MPQSKVRILGTTTPEKKWHNYPTVTAQKLKK